MSVVPAVLYIPDVVGSDVLRVLFSSHQIHPLFSLSSSVIVLRARATTTQLPNELDWTLSEDEADGAGELVSGQNA